MEEIQKQGEEILQRRLVALENAVEMSLILLRDVAYNERHKEKEYRNLVSEFIVLTEMLLGESNDT